ncbi:glycoside hydrolase family 5 protein [Serendipita vermifera MAFF 305830]|uniref:cellulase n=1 Tax=Serendipita vermifera MAFF 305830 TaxID=933852 RepID=A0A0C2X6E9_SERVB|nr:glycoside hydrolase family 5 protein [Serendipita vermifera MAFF 305830]
MRLSVAFAALATFVSSVQATVDEWGQCGGISYSGYSQCQKGSASVTTTSTTPTWDTWSISETSYATTTWTSPSPSPTDACPNRTKFKYFGVNQSSAEFGDGIVPGILDKTYTWPSPSSIDFFLSKGMNSFRIPFMMERLAPPTTGLTGAFDSAYLQGLKTIVSYITSKGGYAAIDPHNYARYEGSVITNYAAFQTFWQHLAQEFIHDPNVIFDLNNEPYGIPATDAASLMQAGINGVRASGATQLILVEGTFWTGAGSWVSSGNAAAFIGITDPLNNFAFEMHQYLNDDGSGATPTCVSPTIGVERLAAASAWLVANGKKGVIGEMGGASNDVCIAAIKGAICHMQQQGGAWLGFFFWAAGPWWGDYFLSMEPPSGATVQRVLPEALLPYV